LFNNSVAEHFGYENIHIDRSNIEIFKSKISVLPSLKIIPAPGHTEGSTLYQIDNRLFTGDVLFSNAYGRVDLAGSNPHKQIQTLSMIRKLDHNLHIYPGHGNNDTLYNIVKNNSFFDDL
jgi:glyoxylase-like metal-dependent hydrolase (beta-lactamase superfamily II)